MTPYEPFTWAIFAKPATELPVGLAITVALWCFFVGSAIGSFLNVVISRMPEGLSVVKPRSRCPVCENQIAARDNIPIFSWLWLRGKCRHCKTPISPQYILVEVCVGLFAMGLALKFGVHLRSIELFFVGCVVVCIAFIDAKHWHIPLDLLKALPLIGLTAGGLSFIWPKTIEPALFLVENTPQSALLSRVIGGVAALLFLSAITVFANWYFRMRGRIGPDEVAMGWGDPLMFGGIGTIIGPFGLGPALFLACIQGIAAFAVLAVLHRNDDDETADAPAANTDETGAADANINATDEELEDEWDFEPPKGAIPFGPFLAIGGLEVALFFEPVLAASEAWLAPFQLL